MTPHETLHIIEMLLDDGMLELAGDTETLATIQEAQLRRIREYYENGDERALRLLYVRTDFIDDNTAIANLMFPRAVRVYDTTTQADIDSRTAVYIPYGKYLNYSSPGFGPGLAHVQTSHYTIHNGTFFFDKQASTQRAKMWYIRQPATFSLSQALELPAEYHIEVATLAAQMLNDMDADERERGMPAGENQPLSIEATGGL